MKYGLYKNELGVEMEVIGFAFADDLHPYSTLGDIYIAISKDTLFGNRQYLVTTTSLEEAGYKLVEGTEWSDEDV